MTALALQGVAVALAGQPVLQAVDLTVAPGEVLVLAGRNGAGKTTLLRVATRLLEPDAGEVALLGEPAAGLSRREMARRVALVPQDTQVPFPYRVSELVLMGRTPHLGLLGFERKRDLEIAEAALARLGISELGPRSILELSGGERQLVAVARALAQETPLLLLDEPTAHLDLARRLELLQLVRALADEGRALLLVSHDLGTAPRVADRVALLAEGRVLAAGAPAEVLRPDLLRQAFGVEAQVLDTPSGPVVLPAMLGAPGPG
jgi:iron complex transport system ATP-binding protein